MPIRQSPSCGIPSEPGFAVNGLQQDFPDRLLAGGGEVQGGRNYRCNKTLHKLDAAGKVTRCKPCPVGYGVYESINVVDPVTGNLLVFSIRKSNDDYAYDVVKDDWTKLDYTKNPRPRVGNIAATVTNYGVIMFMLSRAKAEDQGFYIYKHAEATGAARNAQSAP